jgi:hypothetical protein
VFETCACVYVCVCVCLFCVSVVAFLLVFVFVHVGMHVGIAHGLVCEKQVGRVSICKHCKHLFIWTSHRSGQYDLELFNGFASGACPPRPFNAGGVIHRNEPSQALDYIPTLNGRGPQTLISTARKQTMFTQFVMFI